jgi:hypothetical protein
MSISLGCACGKRLRVPDEQAGKRVQCPGCQAVVRVPAPQTVTQRPSTNPTRSDWPGSSVVDEPLLPAPALKKRKKAKGPSWALLAAVLGVLVVFLGLFCIGGGVLAWFLIAQSSPEKMLVGKWQVDVTATMQLYPEADKKKVEAAVAAASVNEFTSDGTVIDTSVRGVNKGRWRMLNQKSDALTIEVADQSGNFMQFNVSFRNKDQIHVVLVDTHLNAGASVTGDVFRKGFVMKRV